MQASGHSLAWASPYKFFILGGCFNVQLLSGGVVAQSDHRGYARFSSVAKPQAWGNRLYHSCRVPFAHACSTIVCTATLLQHIGRLHNIVRQVLSSRRPHRQEVFFAPTLFHQSQSQPYSIVPLLHNRLYSCRVELTSQGAVRYRGYPYRGTSS